MNGKNIIFNIMAWWGHNLLLRASAEEREKNRENPLPLFPVGIKDFIYNNFLSGLHFSLGSVTYSYLLLVIFVFFFQDSVFMPKALLNTVESLSEPYLGVIGVYLFVKEIRIRRGVKSRIFSELFVALWVIFLLLASFLTLFSQNYHLNPVYNLILTNSLAAIIIRLGTILHF